MNLKLAKRIRQGMREMAGIERPGLGPDFVHPGPGRRKHSIAGSYPDDYEGQIPTRGAYHWPSIFHHDYLHSRLGELWATRKTDDSGIETLQPLRINVRLKLASARQVYQRAKRMVAA